MKWWNSHFPGVMRCLERCQLGCWWEERDAEIRGSAFKLKHPDHLRVCVCSVCWAGFLHDSSACLCVIFSACVFVCFELDGRLHVGYWMTFAAVQWSCWPTWEPGAGVCSPATSLEIGYRPSKTLGTTWIWPTPVLNHGAPWRSDFQNLTSLCLPESLVLVLRIVLVAFVRICAETFMTCMLSMKKRRCRISSLCLLAYCALPRNTWISTSTLAERSVLSQEVQTDCCKLTHFVLIAFGKNP